MEKAAGFGEMLVDTIFFFFLSRNHNIFFFVAPLFAFHVSFFIFIFLKYDTPR